MQSATSAEQEGPFVRIKAVRAKGVIPPDPSFYVHNIEGNPILPRTKEQVGLECKLALAQFFRFAKDRGLLEDPSVLHYGHHFLGFKRRYDALMSVSVKISGTGAKFLELYKEVKSFLDETYNKDMGKDEGKSTQPLLMKDIPLGKFSLASTSRP